MAKSSTSFDENNSAAQRHGGEGALARLREGKPFLGMALELYHSVLARWGFTDADLKDGGLRGDIVRETARQLSVTELLLNATFGAAEEGDLEKWDRLVKRWGWRSDKSLSAMHRLIELQKTDETEIDYEKLLKALRK